MVSFLFAVQKQKWVKHKIKLIICLPTSVYIVVGALYNVHLYNPECSQVGS